MFNFTPEFAALGLTFQVANRLPRIWEVTKSKVESPALDWKSG